MNLDNINQFLSGAQTALTAPVQFGGVIPTPMVAVSYTGYRISRPPAPVNDADTTSDDARLTALRVAFFHALVLISCTTADLTQTTVTLPRDWEKWTCFLMSLGHLTLSSPVTDADISRGIVELPTEVGNNLYSALLHLKGGTPPDFAAYLAAVKTEVVRLVLPTIGNPTGQALAAVPGAGASQEMAALYALSIYLLGRPYSATMTAISTKRTKNLEDKGNRGLSWPSISGPAKMSPGTIKMVSLTWERDPKLRAGAFTPLIGLNLSTADPNLTMITTMTGLLPMSQMSHVKIIMDFMKMYRFIVEMDDLSAEFYELADSTRTWNTYPARIRPYCKLIYRDQFKAFDSKRLVRIVKMAADVMARHDTEVGKYAVKGADQGLLDKFDQLRIRHQPPPAAPVVTPGGAQPGPPTV